MKKPFILLFLSVLLSLYCVSQETDTNSIVFPVRGELIKNVLILEIGPGNNISFLKNNDTSHVLSKAYIKNGEYFDLSLVKNYAAKNPVNKNTTDSLAKLTYNNHNYYFYHDQYQKARKLQRTGIILVGAGSGAAVVGWALYYLGNQTTSLEGFIFILPGVVLIGAGGLAAIGGLVFTSVSIGLKAQNEKYMKLCQPQKPISLHLGIQENGIGARIRF